MKILIMNDLILNATHKKLANLISKQNILYASISNYRGKRSIRKHKNKNSKENKQKAAQNSFFY